MIHSLLQTDEFWTLLLISVAGYYGWVIYTFFRQPLLGFFHHLVSGKKKGIKGRMLKVSWDDLVFAFAIQRKLNQNPTVTLHPEELALLNSSPFREVLGREGKN